MCEVLQVVEVEMTAAGQGRWARGWLAEVVRVSGPRHMTTEHRTWSQLLLLRLRLLLLLRLVQPPHWILPPASPCALPGYACRQTPRALGPSSTTLG